MPEIKKPMKRDPGAMKRIKNKENNKNEQKILRLADASAALILFITSFLIISYYKAPFLHFWDEFFYMKSIILHDIDSYTFPRAAYFEFYRMIWEIARHINPDPLEFHNTVRAINIIFASASISLAYLFIKEITERRMIALSASLILLSTPSYIRYSGTTLQEIMMIFFTLLSFYLFTNGIKNNKATRIYLAAISFAIACSVREQALAYLFFFAGYALAEIRRINNPKRTYAIAAMTFIAASIVPLLYTYPDVSMYLNRLWNYMSMNKTYGIFADFTAENISRHLATSVEILEMIFGNLSILSILGIILLFDRNRQKMLAYILALLSPAVILTIFGAQIVRYYIPVLIGLSLAAAYTIYLASASFGPAKEKIKNILVLAAVLSIFVYNLYTANSTMIPENEEMTHKKTYWESMLLKYSDDTVFMLGSNTAIMKYYTSLTQTNNILLAPSDPGNSGLLEPKNREELMNTIDYYLSLNKTILIESDRNDKRTYPLDIEMVINRYSPESEGTLLIIKGIRQ